VTPAAGVAAAVAATLAPPADVDAVVVVSVLHPASVASARTAITRPGTRPRVRMRVLHQQRPWWVPWEGWHPPDTSVGVRPKWPLDGPTPRPGVSEGSRRASYLAGQAAGSGRCQTSASGWGTSCGHSPIPPESVTSFHEPSAGLREDPRAVLELHKGTVTARGMDRLGRGREVGYGPGGVGGAERAVVHAARSGPGYVGEADGLGSHPGGNQLVAHCR